MKLRKFGVFAAIAALIVAGFSSCVDDAVSSGPKIVVKDYTKNKTITNEVAIADFGTEESHGLIVYITPGKSEGKEVGLKGKLKVHYEYKKGNDIKDDKEFTVKKDVAGDYAAVVSLKGLAISKEELEAATSGKFTFEILDDKGKTGSLTLNLKKEGASEGTAMTDHGDHFMNHNNATNGHYGSFDLVNFTAVPGKVKNTAGQPSVNPDACIQNTSPNSGDFVAGIESVSGKGYTMAKVTGTIDFDKATTEQVSNKLDLATANSAGVLAANDVVLIKNSDGSKYYLLKILEVKTDRLHAHETTATAGNNKGYLKFKIKANV